VEFSWQRRVELFCLVSLTATLAGIILSCLIIIAKSMIIPLKEQALKYSPAPSLGFYFSEGKVRRPDSLSRKLTDFLNDTF